MSKRIRTIVWMAVAFLGLGIFFYQIPREDFGAAIMKIEWSWGVLGVLIYLAAQTLLATRWVLLLRVHGVYISQFQAIKLTYLGLFYNNMMPGTVGGDVLKGWYVTKHSEKHQRLGAAVTVFVDRLVGLIGMILVGAIASLFVGGALTIPVGSRNIQVRMLIWIILAGMVVVSVVFLSRHARRMLMLSKLLEKLPFANTLRKIDQAIQIYRRHMLVMFWALVLTAVIQGLAIVAIWIMCRALHLENVTFLHCLIIMPMVWLVSAAIPVPGGLGVMENLFIPFFARAIDPAVLTGTERWQEVVALAGALAVMNRVMICVCSVPGALVPIFGGHLPKAKEMQQELEKGEMPGGNADKQITEQELDKE